MEFITNVKCGHYTLISWDSKEFWRFLGAELANRLGVPENRIYQIINGQRSITADTALRLGKFFNTGPEFWLNLQKAYELDEARVKIGDSLNEIMPYAAV